MVALHGLVTAAPATCPTAAPCAKPAANVVLLFTRSRATAYGAIKVVRTDARGRYTVQLVPGTWTVQAARALQTAPGKVSVKAGPARTLNLKLTVV